MSQKANLFVFAHLDSDFVPTGKLTLTEEGTGVQASEFVYGLKYLDRGNAVEIDPVSLSLADRGRVRKQRLFPVDNLPLFGGIRDCAPDAWGRRVIEARRKVPMNSLPESVYLLEAGSQRVGALDVRESISAEPREVLAKVTDLVWLLEAAERIEAGLPVPQSLEAIFDSGSGLGGARAKATVRDEDGVLWLAKFRSRGEILDVPAIEAATLHLAKACGLTVPQLKLINVGGRSVMLIRRFDRYWSHSLPGTTSAAGAIQPPATIPTPSGGAPGGMPAWLQAAPEPGMLEKRLPFVSGLTMLVCDEFSAREKSYADLAQAIRRYCHSGLIRQNNRELFARMVFNIFVSNDDDHLRNHGFIRYPEISGALGVSATQGGWGLSPLYDVMPRPGLASERNLFLGVGRLGRLATLDNAISTCPQFALSEADALGIIATVWQQVREWRVVFEQFGLSAPIIEQASSAMRHIDAIASKSLRKAMP